MSLVRRRFDEHYFESWIHHSHPRSARNLQRFGLVLSQKPAGRLLDIGIGRGDLLQAASGRFEVSAIDVSPYAASRLPESLRERVTVGDIQTTALPDPPYDVITAFNVLEHLHRPVAALCKIHAGLAPGGVFIGSMPCKASLVGTVHTAITNYFDKTHCSTYKVRTWGKAFRAVGFSEPGFFGEIMLTHAICVYVRAPFWPHVSLNLMFAARKG